MTMIKTEKKITVKSTVHTLDDTAKDKFSSSDFPRLNAERVDRAAKWIGDSFLWENTAEGHDFWADVTERLLRITGALETKKVVFPDRNTS